MGQKVNPLSLRLKINDTWSASWFNDKKEYMNILHQDLKIREIFKYHIAYNFIGKVIIERVTNKLILHLHTSKPGMIIGKKGIDISKLKKIIECITLNVVSINVVEIKKPEVHSSLISSYISEQLEKRISFRKVIKKSMSQAKRFGVKGIRIGVKGRLSGAEIARNEWYKEGRVPLHTLRAKISYSTSIAKTIYGIIGIKVWIYYGDKINKHI